MRCPKRLLAYCLPLAGLILLLNACSMWRGAPLPKPGRAKAPELPPAPQLESAQVMALARVRDLNELIARGSAWRQAVAPKSGPGNYDEDIKKMGLDPKALKPGEPLGLALWDQEISIFSLPLTLVLPAPVDVAQKLAGEHSGIASAMPPDHSVVAMNQSVLEQTSKSWSALLPLVRGALRSDVQVAINMQAIERRYGKLLNKQVKEFGKELKNADGATTFAQRQMKAQLNALRKELKQLDSVSLGVAFPDQAIEFSGLFAAKPESSLTAAWQPATHAWPDLAQMLKPGLARYQLNLDHPQACLDAYADLTIPMYPDWNAEDQATFRKLMNDVAATGPMGTAGAMGFDASRKLWFEGVMASDNAKELYEVIRDVTVGPRAKQWQALYEKMGFKLIMNELPADELRGRDVTRIQYNIEPGPAFPKEAKEMLETMFGPNGLTVDFVRLGKVIVVAANEPLATVVDRIYAREYAPMAAQQALPSGGAMYGELNVREWLGFVRGMIPEAQRGAMPELAADVPPVSAAAWAEGGRMLGTVHVPKGLVTALAAKAH